LTFTARTNMDCVMSEPNSAADTPAVTQVQPPVAAKPKRKEDNFFVFLIKLILIVVVFRSFIFAPFSIPSESMLPRLMNGDYLLASKWSYGFSRYSLPFSVPLLPEHRVFASQPKPGDIAIFKSPADPETDYIKRVIGVPGDTIQMLGGVLHINGKAVPKVRIADFVVPVSANTQCYDATFEARSAAGEPVCRYPRFTETLPNGVSYNVLDFGVRPQDDTAPQIVPEGHLFMMGDDRDNSMDSRFPAMPGGGVGLVPQDNLVGRATVMMWSTDGSAEWLKPWTWFTAARYDRIGGTF
jgi:signal peptidase I